MRPFRVLCPHLVQPAYLLMGLISCFKEAKLAWAIKNNTGLTVFEKRSYKFKAGASITLAFLAIIGLFRAFQGVV
ncbi:hypothetical protein [Acinetobacter nosocomialis]|uniref:hypothetical protein n=1 Tax=Acinetobacter nosocomialis TaxID=106654 RepID=UPI000DA9C106|nr:hypothetical protein [Acinetobacter nosocomialis]PZL95810.1 hypothetical protein DOL92_17450 [Acinetobacter nosocomialis]